jgi:enoyl-CoA hydratase
MNVTIEHVDRVTIVTIDRPDRRNAVDRATAEELADAFRAFDADERHDVAVLTGSGGTFCAGADLKAMSDDRANRGDGASGTNTVRADGDGPMGPTRMLLTKPVIAAVEGFAVAGGLELALWCDLRVAARDAVFGVFCRRWGVPLIDGGTVRLPRLIGHGHALDLILTGRGVSGDEALRIGLANRITEAGDARNVAIELAAELSALPQHCLREDRLSTYEQWALGIDDAIRNELEHGLRVVRSGEAFDGAARFAAGAGRHGNPSAPAAP